jgi:hypothetical protein
VGRARGGIKIADGLAMQKAPDCGAPATLLGGMIAPAGRRLG